MKTTNVVLICSLALVSFIFGTYMHRSNIGTYRVDGYKTSFNYDWVTYGLPLVEYVSLLQTLREGRTNNAIDRLEMFLDTSIRDAECRRPLLKGTDLITLDKCLSKVANYRRAFPRPHSPNTITNIFWTTEKQVQVDIFLKKFETQ